MPDPLRIFFISTDPEAVRRFEETLPYLERYEWGRAVLYNGDPEMLAGICNLQTLIIHQGVDAKGKEVLKAYDQPGYFVVETTLDE